MGEFLIVAPILPGKRDEWREMMREVTGPRYAEWADLHRRAGATRELVWEQRLPGLDLAIIFIEGTDPDKIVEKIWASDDPFAIWIRERIIDVTGYFETPPEGISDPELVGRLY